MTVIISSLIFVYLTGWSITIFVGVRMKGPVPLPGRFKREMKTSLAWPVMFLVRMVLMVVDFIPQKFEHEHGWKADDTATTHKLS